MNTHAHAREYRPGRDVRMLDCTGFDRLSFGSGVAASVLFLVGVALFIGLIAPRMPAVDAPAPERAAFYAEMGRSALYRGISYMGEMQTMLLLLFFGGLLGVLRRAEGGSGALSFAVFGGGVALALVTPLAILFEDHLMLGFAAAGVDPVIVASVDGLGPLSLALGGFPQVIVLAGTTVLLRRAELIGRGFAWVGFALAVLSALGTGTLIRGALFPLSALAVVLSRIWLLAIAIRLLRHSVRRPADAGVRGMMPERSMA